MPILVLALGVALALWASALAPVQAYADDDEEEPVVLDVEYSPLSDEDIDAVLAVLPDAGDASYELMEGGEEVDEVPEPDEMSAQALSNTPNSIKTYAGATMYETAVAEAKAAYPKGSSSAIIAGPGDAWVDALAAAGLASAKGPILFSEKNAINDSTLKALKDLGVKSVVIVGGKAAVGSGVETDLKNAGITVEARLAGDDCFGTQMAIYQYGVDNGIWAGDMAIIATASWFGDALSVSPVAYARKAPIFLAGGSLDLSSSQKDALAKGGFSTIVITGGTAVVSDSAESSLNSIAQKNGGSCVRLGGLDQYDTSALISEWAVANCGFKWNKAAYTTGKLPYDALAGSVLQGVTKAPMLLVDSTDNATVAKSAANKGKISSIRFFGGAAAISYDLRADIASSVSNLIMYEPTGISYSKMLSMEKSVLKSYNYSTDIDTYFNPSSYKMGDPEFYEFAILNLGYSGKISAAQIDAFIAKYGAGGKLVGTGQDFIDAAKKYNVNEVYLLAHAILESGWGKSELAMGIEVDGVTYYNFFGIGAFDSDPEGGGSTLAGSYGWTSPRKAIMGGAAWISQNYLNNKYPQNTLYKMRWNYIQAANEGVIWKQYATGAHWATGIARVMDSCYFYNGIGANNAGLRYLIPQYE